MKKVFLALLLCLFAIPILAGCSNNKALTIWVGSESVEFYTDKMDEYVETYNSTHEEAFPYEVEVKGVDTGTAASTYLDDVDAGADIFTVAHDNLGKLISGSSSIAPITDAELLAQIQNDNPDIFLDVITGTVDGVTYTFGVPYIAQSLVLYYNTKYISAEQAQTWEGIWQAAKDNNKQALSLAGTDGYNNSFLLLARNATTNATTLRLYVDGVQSDCYATGDDTISVLKWGQRFFTDANGAKSPSSSGWEVELKDEISISFIGGAWHLEAAKASLGDNLGVTVLPTFTITAADAYGTVEAGTVFQSGTFADTKMFVMKKGSDKAEYLQDILLFLSSKEVQEESFATCANLPAYKNALEEFTEFSADTVEAKLASAELAMFDYGIPQPFGYSSKYNTYYYSKGAPDLILEILENDGGNFSTDAEIVAQMQVVESLWKTGARPDA
ncbi:MAG TPA: hypothetical protein P5042_05585 [Candidatus Izemoplasmatales bacterium]|nr:hypothetical protein [Candidatus Izemoplasmatales bacterium]